MVRQLILVFAASMALSACISEADTGAVEAAVAAYHAHQANGEDQAIFDAATPELRASSTLADLARLNGAVRGLRGCSTPARNMSQWNNNMNTSGHFITVVYDRQCEGGPLSCSK